MKTSPRYRDDAHLLSACRDGDAAAWVELIRRYRRLIYSIPYTCGLKADAADDVFQRVAILLFENLGRIAKPEALASWIAITTRRECWALSREAARTRGFDEGEAEVLPQDPPDLVRALDLVQGEHALALAWERVLSPCKELLSALYLEDPKPSHAELATRLGRPVGSLGPTHGRCIEKLRKLYQEQGGELPFVPRDLDAEREAGIKPSPASSPGRPARSRKAR